jgi:hypothetical protein
MACMLATTIWGFLVTPAVMACLAGCAASHGESADVAAVARSLFEAVDRHDGRAACAVLAPAAAESLETGNSACKDEVTTVGLTGGPISRVQVWGDRAQVRAGSDTVFLAQFGGRGWKITAAGCEPRQDRPYDCEIEA